jgi:voltage-dependent potassium channel beta subunit
MNYRRLGRSGIKISELALGSWVTFGTQVDTKAGIRMMSAAYDTGVNFFDNAESYEKGESEAIMGAALRELNWRRSSYLVSTKFYWGIYNGVNERNTLNRKRLIDGIQGSLKRLQLEYVDLIYCHRPDPETPIEETCWAMHNIIEKGQALYWATSEWSAQEITAALEISERHHLHKPITEQPIYNLFNRHRLSGDYVRLYKDYGYGATTWSPLASGLLTGKYKGGIPKDSRAALNGYEWLVPRMTDKEKLQRVEALQALAKELNCSLAQLAIAWCLKNPFVSSVITGASRVEQVQENIKAGDIAPKLTAEYMSRIDHIFGYDDVVEEED